MVFKELYLSCAFMVCVLLTSCQAPVQNSLLMNDEISDEELSVLREELAGKMNENRELELKIHDMQKQLDQLNDKLARYEEIHGALFLDLSYEVISSGAETSETVVYVEHVPVSLTEQEEIVIRAAVEFANEHKVSLWKDRDVAMKYVQGDYDPNEGVLGWSGFDECFAVIDNTSNPPTLRHQYSRDDGTRISFGKYKIP